MKVFQSKFNKLPGTDYREVYEKAWDLYKNIKRKSKRKPYIRSAYFGNNKVFLDYFWQHLHQKHQSDRLRRLKFYACALELLQKTRTLPTIKSHVNKPHNLLYRFLGKTSEGDLFAVQILQDLKKEKKHFLSVFPYDLHDE